MYRVSDTENYALSLPSLGQLPLPGGCLALHLSKRILKLWKSSRIGASVLWSIEAGS